ncbi:hypothetical protein A1O3_06197 [Capronia epimyces CBS 606.96]|uniref:Fucose-specific lectin n=1 Tax=Capronia epimyces CBS 606.96 TaxID=1182542 RepID=W9YJF3_9EURO|nr:uncharacterized protein A1O3_06197 [Capronia epimyces CBS 606.96]EXJ82384.1 hypothetical protein A1O3_06197 [Capronia epimyces CBS 606.96]
MAKTSSTQVPSSDENETEETAVRSTGQDGSYSKLESNQTKHLSDPEVAPSKHFSGLEVVNHGHGYSDLEVAPSHGHLEGIQSGNLQAYQPGVIGLGESQGLMPTHPGVGKDAEGLIAAEKNIESPDEEPGRKGTILGLRRRDFWVVVVVGVVLLVIGAVIGGAIGGTRHHSSSSTESTSNPSGSGSAGSGTATTSSGSAATSTAAKRGIKQGSELAALAWTVSDTRYQYRVYYQDEDNAIKESAYDSLTGSWQVGTVLDGSEVSPGTSIAAASPKESNSGSDSVSIDLYYLDGSLDLRVISSSSGVWSSTPSSSAQTFDKKDKNARLAAYLLECALCPNTSLVAYASNGSVVLYNHTAPEAWENGGIYLEGSESLSASASVANGSSVSFQPYSIRGYADQLNLYYQTGDGNLQLTSWFSWEYQRDHNLNLTSTVGWQNNGNNGNVGKIAANSSIATLYFGDDGNGSPAHVQAVTSGWDSSSGSYSGLTVFDWSDNAWANAVSPTSLQTGSGASAVAAHFYQRVYAVSDGILKQFAVADDGTTWTVIGNVPTL